jgi:hexosaminidase
MFPRLDALSEVVWSAPAQHDWQGFLTRLQPQRLRYAREGINDADSAFAVDFTLQVPRSRLLTARQGTVAIASQSASARSITPPMARTDCPLAALQAAGDGPLGQVLKAAAFDGDRPPPSRAPSMPRPPACCIGAARRWSPAPRARWATASP